MIIINGEELKCAIDGCDKSVTLVDKLGPRCDDHYGINDGKNLIGISNGKSSISFENDSIKFES